MLLGLDTNPLSESIDFLGEYVEVDGVRMKATRFDVKDTILLSNDRVRGMSGLRWLAGRKWVGLFVNGFVDNKSIITIDGIEYRILKKESHSCTSRLVYTKLVAYEDFLDLKIAFYEQVIKNSLPHVIIPDDDDKNEDNKLLSNITTLTENDLLDMPLIKDHKPTHVFLSGMFGKPSKARLNNRIICDKGDFDVVKIENINEENQFLVMYATKVLPKGTNSTSKKPDWVAS